MEAHHQRTIDRLTDHFQKDPLYLALIIGGSVMHGYARSDSDVDFLLITTDQEFARREKSYELAYYSEEFCDYPGGYVDGKIINLQFLHDAARQGNDPIRSAFRNVMIAFTRIPELPDLIARIPIYPEHEREERIFAYYSQVHLNEYFVNQAIKLNDPYLLSQSISNLVLCGGKLLLAYNRILFPSHKRFLAALETAPEKPEGIIELAQQLLRTPTLELANEFRERIKNFKDWGYTSTQAVSRTLIDGEWHWRNGRAPLADW